jgi:hypothetical protein
MALFLKDTASPVAPFSMFRFAVPKYTDESMNEPVQVPLVVR